MLDVCRRAHLHSVAAGNSGHASVLVRLSCLLHAAGNRVHWSLLHWAQALRRKQCASKAWAQVRQLKLLSIDVEVTLGLPLVTVCQHPTPQGQAGQAAVCRHSG